VTERESTMNLTGTKDEWPAARGTMTARCCSPARKPLGVAAAGALLAVLVPKCPLCLAAYLSFLGAAASWVVWLRPIGVALTVAGVALAAWRYLSPSASPERTAARTR
jgi:hypothetical protein